MSRDIFSRSQLRKRRMFCFKPKKIVDKYFQLSMFYFRNEVEARYGEL
jgi:hypothetical protein